MADALHRALAEIEALADMSDKCGVKYQHKGYVGSRLRLRSWQNSAAAFRLSASIIRDAMKRKDPTDD